MHLPVFCSGTGGWANNRVLSRSHSGIPPAVPWTTYVDGMVHSLDAMIYPQNFHSKDEPAVAELDSITSQPFLSLVASVAAPSHPLS